MRFETKRVDLLFTERYYTSPGDQPVKVRCARCDSNLIFGKDKDDPQDRFYCYNATKFNDCFDRKRFEVDKMLPSEIALRLVTEFFVEGTNNIVIIEEATDGVTRFGKTRLMNTKEVAAYCLKALDHLRGKIARGEKT